MQSSNNVKYKLSPDAKLQFHPVAQIQLPRVAQCVDQAFSPDGCMLAIAFPTFAWLYAHSASSETEHGETWTLRSVFTLHDSSARITCMNWNGISLVFGFSNGHVALVQANAKETILRGFQVSEYPIASVEIDLRAQYMAILSGRKEVGFWTVASNDDQKALFYLPDIESDLPTNIRAIHWLANADKPTLLVAYEHQGISRWILDFEGDDASLLGAPTKTQSPISCGTFSPDGSVFLSPKATGGYSAYDLPSRTASKEFPPSVDISSHHRIVVNNTPAKFLFSGQWLVGLNGRGGSLDLWYVKDRILARQIPLGEPQATADRITVCGILRGNAMRNVRIATHVISGAFGEHKVIIFKAFLRDEAVDAPIVLTPGSPSTSWDTYTKIFIVSSAALLTAAIICK